MRGCFAGMVPSIELRALPSLAVLDRLGDPHFASTFAFERDALLFATRQGIQRAPID